MPSDTKSLTHLAEQNVLYRPRWRTAKWGLPLGMLIPHDSQILSARVVSISSSQIGHRSELSIRVTFLYVFVVEHADQAAEMDNSVSRIDKDDVWEVILSYSHSADRTLRFGGALV